MRRLASLMAAVSGVALGACGGDIRDNYDGTYATSTTIAVTPTGSSVTNVAETPNLTVTSMAAANEIQLSFDTPACTLVAVVSGNTFTVNPGTCTDPGLITDTAGSGCTTTENLSGSGSRSPGAISLIINDPASTYTCTDGTTGGASISWDVTGSLQ
jgi:hypothetical protein